MARSFSYKAPSRQHGAIRLQPLDKNVNFRPMWLLVGPVAGRAIRGAFWSAKMEQTDPSHASMPWLYQNVSLITECDTGDVYLLATNNVGFNGAANSGTEYADLMQVERDGVGGEMSLPLSFRALSAGGSAYCTFRAAANTFVDKDGKLALYCHAYKANTDILGRPDSKLKLAEYAQP